MNKQKSSLKKLKFWRSKLQQEVDLIIEDQNKIIPLEVKFKSNQNSKDYSEIKSFIAKYKADKGFVISLDRQQTKEIEGKQIVYKYPFNLKDVGK